MSDIIDLLPGEKPMENAPEVTLAGTRCIPQHYLQYQHTLSSIEQIVLDIDYDDRYPIFVGTASDHLYLQVGVIGYDNYAPMQQQDGRKIVYGRRWRIEPQLPTSEIIQTAFLAVQKAREHEVRELFRFTSHAHTTTPFNCHHDLPLLAQQSDLLSMRPYQAVESTLKQTLQTWMDNVSFDGARFIVTDVLARPHGMLLIDFSLTESQSAHLRELHGKQGTLLIEALSTDALYYALMDKMLEWSNRQVEETFSYRGFRRFSRTNSVQAIAELSYLTREREAKRQRDGFSQAFQQTNYETDKSRVPALQPGPLRDKYMNTLVRMCVKNGILPE